MKSLRSGFALVLLTLSCAVGLVVVTATSASAWGVPSPIGVLEKGVAEVVTVGESAGAITEGATLFARGSNPAGWAITAAQLGFLAYQHKDSIIDFLGGQDTPDTFQEWKHCEDYISAQPPGTFDGTCGDVPPDDGGPTSNWFDTYTKTEIVSSSGTDITVKVTALACPNGCANFSDTWQAGLTNLANPAVNTSTEGLSCRQASGTVVLRVVPKSLTLGPGTGAALQKLATFSCPTGETAVGLHVGARINAGSAGQSYVIDYGVPATYPNGDVKFDNAEVTVRCKNAATGAEQALQGTSDTSGGTVVIPSCRGRLGEGWHTSGVTIAPENPEIDNQPVPDEIQVPDALPFDWDELIPDEDSPEWQECYKSNNGCGLSVWIDGNPCTEGGVCEHWKDIEDDSPDRIKCKFGTITVADKYCLPLRDFYKEGTKTDVGSKPIPDPSGDQDPIPETPTENGPTNPKEPDPTDQQEHDKCFPHGWGVFNPFSWIYKPVKCAIVWAFEPTKPFSDRMTSMKDQLDEKAPFSWMLSLASLPAEIPGQGCPDWRIHVENVDKPILCGTPFGDAMRGARPVFAVLMVGGAVYPLIRSVMYASFPLVKPTPT